MRSRLWGGDEAESWEATLQKEGRLRSVGQDSGRDGGGGDAGVVTVVGT